MAQNIHTYSGIRARYQIRWDH